MTPKLINTQFLFRHDNANGHTDFYKTVFCESGTPGHYGLTIIKNGIAYRTRLIYREPSEEVAREQIEILLLNLKK